MKTTKQELLDAIKEHVAVVAAEARMRKEYPAGTCNAEDEWDDFCKRETASVNNLKRLAKCK